MNSFPYIVLVLAFLVIEAFVVYTWLQFGAPALPVGILLTVCNVASIFMIVVYWIENRKYEKN